jgi:hypothetical protein
MIARPRAEIQALSLEHCRGVRLTIDSAKLIASVATGK